MTNPFEEFYNVKYNDIGRWDKPKVNYNNTNKFNKIV